MPESNLLRSADAATAQPDEELWSLKIVRAKTRPVSINDLRLHREWHFPGTTALGATPGRVAVY